MQTTLSKFQLILKENRLDGFIVTNPYNILYLSGFIGISPQEREAILTVTQNHVTLITARLYQTEARLAESRLAKKVQSKNLKVKIAAERNEIDNFIKRSLKNTKRVGFEENDLKYAEFIKYKKLLAGPRVILNPERSRTSIPLSTTSSSLSDLGVEDLSANRMGRRTKNLNIDPSVASLPQDDKRGRTKLIPTKKLIENLRITKSESELKKIEKAQLISQKSLDKILPTIKVGQTELEIAHTLKSTLYSLGAEGLAFDPIIASGPNSGKPHHVTSDRQLTINDTLLFDFGAIYQNYCADFSRTVFIGHASDQQKNIFNHVLTAQKKALDLIKDGVKHHEPFHAANNHFKQNKLDKYFTHGLGHGIGLEVHEAPYLRSSSPNHQSSINNQQLTNRMVFSVEPGLYFNWGGVRIEDLVTIQNGTLKVFGGLAKELIEIKTNK